MFPTFSIASSLFHLGETSFHETCMKHCERTNVHFAKIKDSEEVSSDPVIFFCNHVSWADFFVDAAVCNGASYISRYMVMFGGKIDGK